MVEPEVLERAVDRLVGQCILSLEDVMEEEGIEDTVENLQSFDERVFCCDGCGWYCSTDELNNETDENLCDDCVDEREDED